MDTRKICLLGDFAVGKTSLLERFVHNQFSNNYFTTIGVKVDTKEISFTNGPDLRLAIWDLAGTYAPTPVFMRYLRGTSGYLLVTDGTRAETLAHALELRRAIAAEHAALPFVGLVNKSDLAGRQEIGETRIEQLAADGDIWLRTSALRGDNVEQAFGHLLSLMEQVE